MVSFPASQLEDLGSKAECFSLDLETNLNSV